MSSTLAERIRTCRGPGPPFQVLKKGRDFAFLKKGNHIHNIYVVYITFCFFYYFVLVVDCQEEKKKTQINEWLLWCV